VYHLTFASTIPILGPLVNQQIIMKLTDIDLSSLADVAGALTLLDSVHQRLATGGVPLPVITSAESYLRHDVPTLVVNPARAERVEHVMPHEVASLDTPEMRRALELDAEKLRGLGVDPMSGQPLPGALGYAMPDAAAIFGGATQQGAPAQSAAPLPLAPSTAAVAASPTAPSTAAVAASPTAPAELPVSGVLPTLQALAPLPGASAAAPAAPAPQASHAGGVELDTDDLPWDERIHAGTKRKNADGRWTAKRSINDPDLVPRVVAQLRAQMAAGGVTTQSAAPLPVSTPAPSTVPLAALPATSGPVSLAAPTQPALPVTQTPAAPQQSLGKPAPTTFADFMPGIQSGGDPDGLGGDQGAAMSEHAPLAPSAAFRWRHCALSVSLEAAYPDTSDKASAAEGTACAWALERTVAGTPPAESDRAPNGVATTREMLEAVDLVLQSVEAKLGPRWREMVIAERKVKIPRIHAEHCSGTPDLYAWAVLGDGRRILYVWDLKFGRLVVEAFENEQLVSYACGLMSQEQNINDQNVVLDLTIVQPRVHHPAGSVRTWQVLGSGIRALVNILAMQGEKALAPNPPARPTPEGCRDCSGRHVCQALQREGYAAADVADASTPVELTPQALGLEQRALTRALALLEARVKGNAAQIEATIRAGTAVPGWALPQGAEGRLEWTVPAAQAAIAGDMMGIDIRAPADVITPTQAIAKGVPEAVVTLYAKRKPAARKLVVDDGTLARLTFGSSNT
jgi:hypothetical protein